MNKNNVNLKKRDDGNESGQTKNTSSPQERCESIKETGSILIKNNKYTIYCMTIIGEIEGHYLASNETKTTKYEHIIPQLVSIEEDPKVDGLLILLNTVGGDIEAGLALAELISGMQTPSVSMVLGGGHSIGVPLAVSAKESFIAKSASMTIHPVRTSGLTLGVYQSFEHIKRMQKRITEFVVSNSHISADRFLELAMNTSELTTDIGTVLDGQEAVDEGLIDHVGTLAEAIRDLHELIKKNKKK
ncbi:MAG: ATP-dependent Clp protease proteolytic subunit [Clostridia bacterium]|nr:ATP-dependent Clp protease proteolytic subunit [Clostridia bacterium]